MKTLSKDLSAISFFEREKVNGQTVFNKCGRDFLYYALNYYYPARFNRIVGNPREIDAQKLFGQPIPAWLAWTMVQFFRVPEFLRGYGLTLSINDQEIRSYFDFIHAVLFSRKKYEVAIADIENAINHDNVCAVDISLGFPLALFDHVIFVYGYDEENLYVVDTHKVRFLQYENVMDNRFFYKFSKKEIRERWTRFGRVWKVVRVH